ncbi:type II toxin-antitoxin system RelE/ParE family toxin [Cupriavidus sp. UME77]|uniref:type II toxin-antitoxin system RelE family toxin n=1 Tax=Cupriavidus sp. UME77 TaxID=1862321 RepID=UPI0015FF0DE1|nr:type II toxin-antitoxin system RelE/ParE family toxin [Cupriavidus sp. UME77]MBB1630961.1 addiction module toxin RelE [Cupriavidus sp. UME77]
MSYELAFHEDALKEWKKLDASIKDQFRKQLETRLVEPRVPSAKLSGKDMKDVYKIKLRDAGYRLVYEVNDRTVTVLVLAVGRRDKSEPYRRAGVRR